MKEEAERWVANEIGRLRALDYRHLVERIDHPVHLDVTSASGEIYILETQVFWDGRRGGALRVMVDVWDPRRRVSLSIARDDFIRAPDGSFVDEG